MHKFLRSIGYSNIGNKELEEILHEIILHPDVMKVTKDSEGNEFAELSKSVSTSMGITIRGTYSEDDEFHMDYYFPVLYGTTVTTQEIVEVEKHAEKESYAGVCDDVHLGVTLIFYLQNVADYLAESVYRSSHAKYEGAVLSALSVEGKILLPIKETVKAKANSMKSKDRSQLVAEAREGHEDALENLTLDDMDTYNMISRRVMNEDLFSIVSSTFMPYGIESDQYSILGTIRDFSKVMNKFTGEEIYCMNIECNEIVFDVCINEKDLLGEPAVGRRFKGNVWMQGSLCLE